MNVYRRSAESALQRYLQPLTDRPRHGRCWRSSCRNSLCAMVGQTIYCKIYAYILVGVMLDSASGNHIKEHPEQLVENGSWRSPFKEISHLSA